MMEQSYLTVEEVAKELRVSTDTVLRLIKRGELVAVRVGVKYRISREDYQQYLSTRRTDKEESNQ